MVVISEKLQDSYGSHFLSKHCSQNQTRIPFFLAPTSQCQPCAVRLSMAANQCFGLHGPRKMANSQRPASHVKRVFKWSVPRHIPINPLNIETRHPPEDSRKPLRDAEIAELANDWWRKDAKDLLHSTCNNFC